MTDFLSLFKLSFHLDFCARFISLFQTIMEKRITGERRDTVTFNTEHSTCFQLSTRERNWDTNALPLPPCCLFTGCYQTSLNIYCVLNIRVENIRVENHFMKYEENSECKVNIILSVNFSALNVMSDIKEIKLASCSDNL